MYIDSHAHLTDSKYEDVEKIIKNFRKEKVELVINIGYDGESSCGGKILAEKYDDIYFAGGFHPSELNKLKKDSYDTLITLLAHRKAVAYGEIGLDYHYEGTDRELQKKEFITQLQLADSLKLPVVIHMRDATEDLLKIVKEQKSHITSGAVLHCFSGSVQTAREFLNLGFYISFGGTCTFKNCRALDEVARFTPLERILTETDSPYLSPEPIRGSVNEPKNVVLVAQKLTEYKNIELEIFTKTIKENTLKLFKKVGK